MKKLISLLLITIIMVSTIPFSFAASLSTIETNILNELKSGAKIGSQTIYLPNEYIKQAENYFLSTDIIEDKATKILSGIAEGKVTIATLDSSVINSNGTLNFNKIPTNVKNTLVQNATSICNEVGLVFTINGTNVKIVDKAGTMVFTGEVVIKNTGIFNYIPYVIASIVLLLVFGFAIASRRKFKAN